MRGGVSVMMLVALLFVRASAAQDVQGPPASPSPGLIGTLGPVLAPPSVVPSSGTGFNPLGVLEAASGVFPGGNGGFGSGGMGPDALGAGGKGISPLIGVMVLLTVVSLAPALILMTTCFVRVIVVLGLLKQAIGASTVPPPQVVTALALFTTMLVMAPTVDRIRREAVVPYQAGEVSGTEDLWSRAKQPIRDFMFAQIDATGNWSSVYMVLDYRGVDTSEPERLTRSDVDMVTLVPAFLMSELKTAFLMGFRVYLPFLVIDMVVSSILISMSMMMLPPVIISLPFKLLLFVLVDGWQLVVGSLMRSFVQPGSIPGGAALHRATEWVVPWLA